MNKLKSWVKKNKGEIIFWTGFLGVAVGTVALVGRGTKETRAFNKAWEERVAKHSDEGLCVEDLADYVSYFTGIPYEEVLADVRGEV